MGRKNTQQPQNRKWVEERISPRWQLWSERAGEWKIIKWSSVQNFARSTYRYFNPNDEGVQLRPNEEAFAYFTRPNGECGVYRVFVEGKFHSWRVHPDSIFRHPGRKTLDMEKEQS